MKVFYGGIFVEREILHQAGIEHPIKLEYYKMINQNKQTNYEQNIYGIDIVKTEYRENNIITEEKELKYLSKDENKINQMLNLLKEYIVTPISAQDVVEDLLKESV